MVSNQLIVAIVCAAACSVLAQQRPPPAMNCTQCPTSESFVMVTIKPNDTHRNVETTTCPPYENPGWENPNSACVSDQTYVIPLKPTFAKIPIPLGEEHSEYNGVTYLKTDPKPILGALGVLKNGVLIFGVGSPCGFSTGCPGNGAPTEYVDAVDAEGHTVDSCAGHASPTGAYHIHSGIGINSTEQRKACRLPEDMDGEHSQLLGWMFDGFGLYGRYSLDGKVPTDLDKCSGHTHKIDGVMTYHYHLPDQFPWTIGCFKGCPEVSNNERELGTINSNEDYGCPEGLPADPNTVGVAVMNLYAIAVVMLVLTITLMIEI